MTPEKQRIAIAEACGFVFLKEAHAKNASGMYSVSLKEWSKDGGYYEYLPDYLSDLNAMHEVEEVLYENHDGTFEEYAKQLGMVMFGKEWKEEVADVSNLAILINATAPQRAEAFLRTIGKWEE